MSAELEIVHAELQAAAAVLKRSAEAIASPAFFAQVAQSMSRAQLRSVSPWCDREAAAAYLHCSPSEIDRAADAGVITRYQRAGTPLFKRAELDAAIEQGKWPKRAVLDLRRKAA